MAVGAAKSVYENLLSILGDQAGAEDPLATKLMLGVLGELRVPATEYNIHRLSECLNSRAAFEDFVSDLDQFFEAQDKATNLQLRNAIMNHEQKRGPVSLRDITLLMEFPESGKGLALVKRIIENQERMEELLDRDEPVTIPQAECNAVDADEIIYAHRKFSVKPKDSKSYPYVTIRIMASVYTSIPVVFLNSAEEPQPEKAFPVVHPDPFLKDGRLRPCVLRKILKKMRQDIRLTGLRMCLVLGPDLALYVEKEGSIERHHPPYGGIDPGGVKF
ncbi:MAG: hypothetical protein KDD68_19880 [Bdellovibrionales bacterium]|nr:hypothetical protein [Bdellovibrionales bacterium]